MIIFVGDKPSKANLNPNIAFVGTKSYKRLLEWIYELDLSINDVVLCNKENINKYVYIDLFFVSVPGFHLDILISDRIIALGNNASKHLTKLGITHHKMDHPSGLNHKLNDRQYVKSMLQSTRKFINEST